MSIHLRGAIPMGTDAPLVKRYQDSRLRCFDDALEYKYVCFVEEQGYPA